HRDRRMPRRTPLSVHEELNQYWSKPQSGNYRPTCPSCSSFRARSQTSKRAKHLLLTVPPDVLAAPTTWSTEGAVCCGAWVRKWNETVVRCVPKAIVYRFAENQNNRLPELAADLVRRQVAVIATAGDDVPSVVKAATATIPIVFIIAQDLVRMGLVASLARPGANLTGINFFASELMARRLELLRELVPTAVHIAVLINPANVASAELTVRDVEAAARAMSL